MKYIFIIFSIFISLNAAQKPLEKVSLQLQWLDQFQFAGYYMAKEKGFYRDAGFDVDIRKFTYETDVIDEVLSGRATYGIGRSSLIWNYYKGKEVCLLAAAFQSSPFVLIALNSSNIKSIKDFAGKTVMMTRDAVETASINAMITSSKVDEHSINFKEHTFNLEELIDGRVDLYAAYISNEPLILNKKEILFTIFSPKDIGFDFYSDILFTSKKESSKNHESVNKFKEASIKGWEYAFANIEEAVDIVYEKYNPTKKTKEALLFEAVELKKLSYADGIPLGTIEKSKIERILDIYRVMGLIQGDVNPNSILFNEEKIVLTEQEENYLKEKKEIRICVAPSSLPFSAVENGKFIGIGADILNLTKESVNISYKLVETKSWEESMQNITDKKCDLLPIARYLQKQQGIKYTTPYHNEPLVIVTSKQQNYILDIDGVLDREFAVVKGSPCVDGLKEKYPNIKLHDVDSLEAGFRGVEDGKYYGYIDNLITVAYAFSSISNGHLKISGRFDDKVGLSFGVRDDDEVLFNIFEKLSQSIKHSDIHHFFNEWVSIKYINSINFAYVKESVFLILLVIFIFFYRQHILKKKNIELEELKDKLLNLNKTLELKIADAVEEMQKKETYLLHKSRMAQMGEMMSMVAHQWKQPLSSIAVLHISILMAIELEEYNLDDKKEREKFLNFLNEKLEKIGLYTQDLSKIISEFSDFYKPNKYKEETNLGDVVLEAYKLLEDNLSMENINVRFELNSINRAMLFKNEFIQVIINIINNAKEQFREKNISNAQLLVKSYDRDELAVLEISDNGGGIAEDIIDNIFDPYFSTKLDKNGTGLGLHMSKNIIEQHHSGKIYAKNIKNDAGVNIGATFTIEIKGKELNDEQ